jgi:hypothetical protein
MEALPNIITADSITVIVDGKPQSVRSDNVNFESVKAAIYAQDWKTVSRVINQKQAVQKFVADSTDGEVEVTGNEVLYNGTALEGVVVDKLLEMMREGLKDSTPFVQYIKRLMKNPSSNSVQQLYTFLGYKSLPITPEGKVLGYKGVREDFWSSNGNTKTVVLQGKTDSSGRILNEVGATIEVQRSSVDDNKGNHCSHGLHVGSFDYADGWAGHNGRLLLVEFDPEDAVSVPTDCNFQKLRVCKYKVVADITESRHELGSSVYSPKVNDDEDYDEDYEEDEEDDEYDYEYDDVDDLTETEEKVYAYIDTKHEDGVYPTLKQVQSRMKGTHLSCSEIAEMAEDLGFSVENDEDVAMSQWRILE